MMMIFTSCIHHFMAVNYQRVYNILAKEFPEIDFVDCYMDPIMRRTNPVVPSLWRQMHRVLRYTEAKNPSRSPSGQLLPSRRSILRPGLPAGSQRH